MIRKRPLSRRDRVAEIYDRAYRRGLRPDSVLTVSQWADKNRILSGVSASEPGPWRTDRTPYLREIMDCLSANSPYQDVVFEAGTQLGKTETGSNFVGYVIEHAPGPLMIIQPTLDSCDRYVTQRLNPLIESTPSIRAKIGDRKSRTGGNTARMKAFPGGVLVLTGANSAAGLRAMPCRFLFFDELDGYPLNVDGEGDPVELAEKRSSNFRRRKRFKVSTPTKKRTSKIDRAYLATDQRRYFVPCPLCGHKQVLVWDRIKWDRDEEGRHLPETVGYQCESCEERFPERFKTEMLKAGEWRPTAPENADGRTAGFHLSALYSPIGWLSWADVVRQFLKAVAEKKTGSLEKLIAFTNTVLAECWEERGEAPAWEVVYGRREQYPQAEDGSVLLPRGILFLTAGVDVQADRLEVQVVGWGRGKESWTVSHFVLPGDPYQSLVWQGLAEVLHSTHPHEFGVDMPIIRMAVDSGYATQAVYAWGRSQPSDRLLIIKGSDNASIAIGQPSLLDIDYRGQRAARGARVWPVGTHLIKSELYGLLRLSMPEPGLEFPPGYCHFSDSQDQEFFKQLTSEELVTKKNPKGFDKREWIKTRERNEALDCRVYARAAASQVGLDRMTEESWARLEAYVSPSQPLDGKAEEPARKKLDYKAPAAQRKVTPSKWMNSR